MIRLGLNDDNDGLKPTGTLKKFLEEVTEEKECPEAVRHIELAKRVQRLYGGELNDWLRMYDQELNDKIRNYENK